MMLLFVGVFGGAVGTGSGIDYIDYLAPGIIIMMLLFVGVFGGAVGTGSGIDYIDYLAPGIIIMSAGTASAATAVKVCQDMAEGIIDRFRTMDIARSSVLTGQVVGSVVRTVFSSVLVVGVALLLGFSPSASFGDWLAVLGIFTPLTVSLTWPAVPLGWEGD